MKVYFIVYRTKITPYLIKGFTNKVFYQTFKAKYKIPNEEEYQKLKAEQPDFTKEQYKSWKGEQEPKTDILYCYEVERKEKS